MTCSLCWLNFFAYFLRGIYGLSLIGELLIYILSDSKIINIYILYYLFFVVCISKIVAFTVYIMIILIFKKKKKSEI